MGESKYGEQRAQNFKGKGGIDPDALINFAAVDNYIFSLEPLGPLICN
jgi:hypothetical protein